MAGFMTRLAGRAAIVLGLICAVSMAMAQGQVPRRLLVKFREGIASVRQNAIFSAANARVEGSIPQLGIKVVEISSSAPYEAVRLALRKLPDVEFAEPDWIVPHAQVVPNDPMYSSQQSYYNRIGAPFAWAMTTGSSSLVVAVLDTGINSAHPDLVPNLVPGWNVYSNNSDTTDLFGHGTSTAGTVAATSNNGLGVASVAWGCKIMPIRICSSSSSSAPTSVITQGLVYAADHGAKVANISYNAGGNATVAAGAQYFQSKGGVVSISAGNYSTNLTYASSPYYLLVGASSSTDTLSSYSNYGTPLDLVAPGDVVTTTYTGGYGGAAGTSFSSPLVAGVVALMMSANPELTPQRVMELIKANCDDLGSAGWDIYFGNGRLNASKAVQAAVDDGGDVTPPEVSFTAPTNGATVSGTVTVQVNATDSDGAVSEVSFSVDGSIQGTLISAPFSWSWNTSALSNGNHTLVATARDAAGNQSTATITVNVQNADTTPPTVSFTSPSNGATVSGTVSVQASASDAVGVTQVSLTANGSPVGTDTSAPYAWSWNTSSLANGSYTLVATARDAAGNQSTATITVNVQNADTTPPTVSFTSPSNGATVSGTVSVQASASDAVGVTQVSLTANGSPVGTDTSAPYAWSWNTSSLANGSYTLVATARDAAGNQSTATITVNVQNADTTPPTVVITSPTGGYMGRTLKVMVSVSDNVAVTRTELYFDGVLVSQSTSSPFTLYFNATRVTRGNHSIRVKAYDAAGNSSWSNTVTVRR